jgi:hypothetical protein
MELLIATLAHTRLAHELDGQAQVRQVTEALRATAGLLAARTYMSRDRRYHLMLTTWENEAVWQKARERSNPARLLREAGAGLLSTAPEQWVLRYLWGYVRPAVTPTLAVALLARIRPEQGEGIEQSWLESLHRQAAELLLAAGFLARGSEEELTQTSPAPAETPAPEPPFRRGSIFLNLLCWASEVEQEEFYAHGAYQHLSQQLNKAGSVQMLALEQP